MLQVENFRKIPQYLIEEGKTQIQDLLYSINGVNFVMLCSADGFELALLTKKNLSNAGKIAAVGSSILAMISAFASEMQLTGCQNITLDAKNGKVLLSTVNHPKYPMLIIALAESDALIGQLLYSVKNAAKHLAALNEKIA